MKKRVTSFIMSFILIASFLFTFDLDVKAISQNDVVSQLNSYISQYNGRTANSNQMYMGSQCKGFANWIFLKIFGVYIGPYPTSANYKITDPKAQTVGIIEPGNLNAETAKALLQKGVPGDYIQVQRSTARGRGPHSMILTGVNDNGIEVFDCNSDGKNTIKTYSISWSSFDTANRAMSLYHAYNYEASSSMPSNPQISKSQHWYDLQDRIEISAYADGATSYFMSMFKDGNKIISQGVDGGKFGMAASAYGRGDYSAYFSCTNSAGTVDTKWIDFSVVGEPGYSDVRTSASWYDLTDTVSITVDTVCAKWQWIGIDKEGVGRVITELTEPTYEIAASKLGIGKYSAYFTVCNGSGGVDTRRVEFEIVNEPKEGAIVSSSKKNYALDDEVQISVSVQCSNYQWIGIDKEGAGRIITERTTEGKYQISASELGEGKYSAYFTVCNGSGGYDTDRVDFSIGEEKCNHDYISEVTKKATCNTSGVRTYTCVKCKENYTEIIPSTGHTWDTGTVTKEATSLADGIKTYTCTSCGKTKIEIIPATGQNEADGTDKEDTSGKNEADGTDKEDTSGKDDVNIGDEENVDKNDKENIDKSDKDNSDSSDKENADKNNAGNTENTDSDAQDSDADEENTDVLEVGDLVEDVSNGDEYEIISIKGNVICVEYLESANAKASTITIPAAIKTEEGIICKVTSISQSAFKNNKKIKKVLIGSNVKVIGTKAFSGCKNLTSVCIGKNVTTIGANAFFGCKKLKKLDFKTDKLTSKGMNKKALKGIPAKALIHVPKGKQAAYKKLFIRKGLDKKNRIR